MSDDGFSWSNVPDGIRAELTWMLGPTEYFDDLLKSAFGTTPGENLVDMSWAVLRDRWLAGDADARTDVVAALRTRGLGDMELDASTPQGEMEYLRSCRNSASLREIVLAKFIELGAPPMGATAPPAASTAEDDSSETAPDDAGDAETAAVMAQVLATLREFTENPELEPDGDGDIGLRYGSSVVFVHVFGSPPIVRVNASVLEQVEATDDVLAALNEQNQNPFNKWLLADGGIITSIDLFGSPFQPEHLIYACQLVGSFADDLDETLQQRFGGKTFFGEYVAPRFEPPTQGYL